MLDSQSPQHEENKLEVVQGIEPHHTSTATTPPSSQATHNPFSAFSTNTSPSPQPEAPKAETTPLSLQDNSELQRSRSSDPATTNTPKKNPFLDAPGEGTRPVPPPPARSTIAHSNAARKLHDQGELRNAPSPPTVHKEVDEESDDGSNEESDEDLYDEERNDVSVPDTEYRTGQWTNRPHDFAFGPWTDRVASLSLTQPRYAGQLWVPGFERSDARRSAAADIANVDRLFSLISAI